MERAVNSLSRSPWCEYVVPTEGTNREADLICDSSNWKERFPLQNPGRQGASLRAVDSAHGLSRGTGLSWAEEVRGMGLPLVLPRPAPIFGRQNASAGGQSA